MAFFEFSGSGSVKWSKVTIDADKDMGGYGLSDLKELALGMNVGDILCLNAATGELAIVSPGIISTELLTKGTTFPPVWGFPDTGG